MDTQKSIQHTILLVDDTPLNLEVLILALQRAHLKLLVAQSGQEALDICQRVGPDVILLDVVMPDMDGFEVCRRLKADPRTNAAPIIFMTALTETIDKLKGFRLGAVDYITKPFQAEEALARINAHLTAYALQTRLEEMVQARTDELAKKNEQLRQEIAERERTATELRQMNSQITSILESMSDGFFSLDTNLVVTYFNPAAEQVLHHTCSDVLGRQLFEVFPEARGSIFEEKYRHALHTRQSVAFETYFGVPPYANWYDVRVYPYQNGIAVYFQVITERKTREIAIEHEHVSLQKENLQLKSSLKDRYRFGDLIGKSPAMQAVYEQILNASASDANVVILGESGTGKELVAWTIHHQSKRQKNAFVPVNCGAITESLGERELFGHRKGVFTGAYKDHPGFFDAAEGGTLFLDEVAELPLNMQVKLLRVLSDGGYTPVGGQTTRTSDVRIIAATNQDLIARVQAGNMREDFYYRIHVIPIILPPLRSRKDDLPFLIDHLLRRMRSDLTLQTLPAPVLNALYAYDWPGNVRELDNVLQRYAATGQLDFLSPRRMSPLANRLLSAPSHEIPLDAGFRETLETYEKQLIRQALERTHWHRTKTAELLRLPRKTLFRKMKQYGLE